MTLKCRVGPVAALLVYALLPDVTLSEAGKPGPFTHAGQVTNGPVAEFLGIDDRHRATIVARDIVADADREQLDVGAQLDPFDHVAQVLLEVTETVLIDNRPDVLFQLRKMVDAGVTVALDDFGTGHSSLSHLRRFPIDTLKIDREFTSEVESPRGCSLVTAVAHLARAHATRPVLVLVPTAKQGDAFLEDLKAALGETPEQGRVRIIDKNIGRVRK